MLKHALTTTAATLAVLALTACGGDSATTTEAGSAEETTTSSSSSEARTTPVGDEVREACAAAAAEQLAGAELEGRGTLRGASTEGGRVFTLTGTVVAEGTSTPFTCEVSAPADGEVAVDSLTLATQ